MSLIRFCRIHIGGNCVWFTRIPSYFMVGSSMRHRIKHRKHLHCFITITKLAPSDDAPNNSMSILGTVLPDSRRITLYISRAWFGLIESWSQQPDNSKIPLHQLPVERVHCLNSTIHWCCP